MKYLVPLLLATSPALAHEAGHAHVHADGVEGWIVAITTMGLLGLSLLIWKRLQ